MEYGALCREEIFSGDKKYFLKIELFLKCSEYVKNGQAMQCVHQAAKKIIKELQQGTNKGKGLNRIVPVIGQEAVCPDGLGRVVGFDWTSPNSWVQVSTYINNRSCKWDSKNVYIVPIIGLSNDRL